MSGGGVMYLARGFLRRHSGTFAGRSFVGATRLEATMPCTIVTTCWPGHPSANAFCSET